MMSVHLSLHTFSQSSSVILQDMLHEELWHLVSMETIDCKVYADTYQLRKTDVEIIRMLKKDNSEGECKTETKQKGWLLNLLFH